MDSEYTQASLRVSAAVVENAMFVLISGLWYVESFVVLRNRAVNRTISRYSSHIVRRFRESLCYTSWTNKSCRQMTPPYDPNVYHTDT